MTFEGRERHKKPSSKPVLLSYILQDDAGGPLVNKVGDQYYLVGVPSLSRGCAVENVPAVYMRMTAFEDWINDVLVGNITGTDQAPIRILILLAYIIVSIFMNS